LKDCGDLISTKKVAEIARIAVLFALLPRLAVQKGQIAITAISAPCVSIVCHIFVGTNAATIN
jgi:hypothetical protein